MNDNKKHFLLWGSLAANIFLVAFTLGRFSGHGAPMHGPYGPGGPPPFADEAFMGHRPPPPHFFGPDALFGPDEMRADEARMRADFDKINGLRRDFAAQLNAGPVSRQAVLDHFAAIDQITGAVRQQAQDKAADRISKMSDAERRKFAQELMRAPDHGPGPDGPDDGEHPPQD